MTKDEIRLWVVKNASVTNPYKKYWSASVTLGYDINGTGNTIEAAYKSLTEEIYNSNHLKSLINVK